LCWPPCRRRRRPRPGTLRSAGPRSVFCSRTRIGVGTPTPAGYPTQSRIRGLPRRDPPRISSVRTTFGSRWVVQRRAHMLWPGWACFAISCTLCVRAGNGWAASSDHLRHTFRAAVSIFVFYSLPSRPRKRPCHKAHFSNFLAFVIPAPRTVAQYRSGSKLQSPVTAPAPPRSPR